MFLRELPKLGGKNSLLAVEQIPRIPLISEIPTMILGMDVSHGSPGQSDIPSIVAVVGSRCWPLISRYRASVRTQSPKVEMIDSLYKVLPNGKDDGIMRDGVSESQFNQVLNVELEQIIKAITHLGETKLPKFTLIVAQKNHHTKLFKAGGRPENVPPGFTLFSFKLVVIHSIHPTWGEDNTPEYWAFHSLNIDMSSTTFIEPLPVIDFVYLACNWG